ncbi:HNH endonuclease [Bradyrhizobium sp. BRP56]|uniref:HNH endonuclease n=1 Tax=Bradyrhizobium sp. BRP56 TaxID=2793819 RepID=UPI001CD5D86F|nr:HNH endonuclease [Bradyrhizobium sp. BRP56]MCA1401330.1 HNH endonuclease [Bradyrhizobium sp. BRP56]
MIEQPKTVEGERERREELWTKLSAAGGPSSVSAALLNELKIFYGGRGIWVDKAKTQNVGGSRDGVTVGLLHSGAIYEDDLFADGAIYHYPTTEVPGRDAAEIAATKAAQEFALPVFLSILNRSTGLRDVKLAWVESCEDILKQFKLTYAEQRPAQESKQDNQRAFLLTAPRTKEEKTTNRSKRHPGFKFDVLSHYGDVACCLCEVRALRLLDAAHIIDVQHDGTDDPRNGLILCANHHRAYDAQMIAIEPGTYNLKCAPKQPSFDELGITKTSIASLSAKPHHDALIWRWDRWKHKG